MVQSSGPIIIFNTITIGILIRDISLFYLMPIRVSQLVSPYKLLMSGLFYGTVVSRFFFFFWKEFDYNTKGIHTTRPQKKSNFSIWETVYSLGKNLP